MIRHAFNECEVIRAEKCKDRHAAFRRFADICRELNIKYFAGIEPGYSILGTQLSVF